MASGTTSVSVTNWLVSSVAFTTAVSVLLLRQPATAMMPQMRINSFFIAYDGDKIVATAGIRAYDKDYEYFRGMYSKEDTASIWRLMVDENYRRYGLARKLVGKIESFSKLEGYSKIYLHTHRYLDAALPFWKSLGYKIVLEEDDYDETTHMEKCLN